MANTYSSHRSYGDRTMPLSILRALSCITRTAAVRYGDRTATVRCPYCLQEQSCGDRTVTVRPPYARTMLRLSYQNYIDRTVTYGDRTVPFDIVCKDNPTATVRSPHGRRTATVRCCLWLKHRTMP